MRLWHYKLLSKLDNQRLLGQHRECCALRGKGWGRKHSTVDYVFRHNYLKLSNYHKNVMWEMKLRGMKPDMIWWHDGYRGKKLEMNVLKDLPNINRKIINVNYIEHNSEYLQECVSNIAEKVTKKLNKNSGNRMIDIKIRY